MPFGAHNAGARENAEVRRHRVLRHVELASNFASSQAGWFVADKQTEHVEARTLSERPKGGNGSF
ncbi:hypothetical protein GCM10007870_30120 [Gluconobacter kondonii]|uniref:Uncharacterized protein n=1 Tax=Gluconobacter kondonii TaxID=941463 RepID=A0ABQ5WWK7_9PROT|nr:hypothetical protein AA3266_2833 [Gluconobacter kondonii NBRC 3266]GLQ67427.1 hypothetical protein GCM10007870_30120 [Gluconobacter kondonii]